MGVHVHGGTMEGAVTPICNECNVALCWDIAEEEYDEDKQFWDAWICRDCNGGVALSRNSGREAIVKMDGKMKEAMLDLIIYLLLTLSGYYLGRFASAPDLEKVFPFAGMVVSVLGAIVLLIVKHWEL